MTMWLACISLQDAHAPLVKRQQSRRPRSSPVEGAPLAGAAAHIAGHDASAHAPAARRHRTGPDPLLLRRSTRSTGRVSREGKRARPRRAAPPGAEGLLLWRSEHCERPFRPRKRGRGHDGVAKTLNMLLSPQPRRAQHDACEAESVAAWHATCISAHLSLPVNGTHSATGWRRL